MFSPLLVGDQRGPEGGDRAAAGRLAFGWGQQPILIMVFLLCFFPIVLATATGLTTTPADLVELARSLDASRCRRSARYGCRPRCRRSSSV